MSKINRRAERNRSGKILELTLGMMMLATAAAWATDPDFNDGAEFPVAPAKREAQKIVGLAIVVDFPDERTTVTQKEADEFFNRKGGIGGNHPGGSVYDYFYDISNGLLEYTNIVPPVLTMPRDKSFYDKAKSPSDSLITDALKMLSDMKFDLAGITADAKGTAAALNVLFAGTRVKDGLWSVQGIYRGGATLNGIIFRIFQSSQIGVSTPEKPRNPSLSLVLHENGHMVGKWPDLYHRNAAPSGTVGKWCLMGDGFSAHITPNAYFRHLRGWIDVTDITNAPPGSVFSIEANSHRAFVYRRNEQEAYFIEARKREGPRNSDLPGSGLAIWHVHTGGSNRNPDLPRVALVQADGRRDLRYGVNSGDATDLFRLGVNTKFNKNTVPAAVWHDGTPSNISISRISDTGAVMTFKTGDEDYVDEVYPKYKFYHQMMAYATAAENVEAVIDQNTVFDMLVNIPTPRTAGVTLTVRSKDPAAPVTITRGAHGNLFTISDSATLILKDIIIDGGSDNKGGGDNPTDGNGSLIRANAGGTLVMNDGAVLRNNVYHNGNGGGVHINKGAFIMNGGAISGNTVDIDGGGVYLNGGAFTMRGGTISGNTANNRTRWGGGGVRLAGDGVFTMQGGKISGNTAGNGGGGVDVTSKTAVFIMDGGEISGNTAKGGNGVTGGGTFTMRGGVVAGTGRNANAVVSASGTRNLNTGAPPSPNNGVIIAWNKPAGDAPLSYTDGANTHLTVSPDKAATAVWIIKDGRLGISYKHGANAGFIDIGEAASTTAVIPQSSTPVASQLPVDKGTPIVPPQSVDKDAPTDAPSGKFTVIPNPAVRSSGGMTFYWQGGRLNSAVLPIFNSSGKLVSGIEVKDSGKDSGDGARRRVGVWNLRDLNGRAVPAGRYTVRGVLITSSGEDVRVVLSVEVR